MRSTARAFDALGSTQRQAIVTLLAKGPQSVQEIADGLPISRPAVSRHLKVLREAGLVVDVPAGNRRLYRLRDEGAEVMREYLREVWGEVEVRFRLFAENTERREP